VILLEAIRIEPEAAKLNTNGSRYQQGG